MLTNLAKCKAMLSIPDSSEDIVLGLIMAGVDAAIKKFTKRDLEYQQYTEYVSGKNQMDLAVRQRPVNPLILANGTVTSSGTAITATLPIFTAAMFGSPITDGSQQAIITGFVSPTVVTVAAAPNPAWLNTPINVSGIQVWVDYHGRGGQNPAGFLANTQLIQGKDFIAVVDGPNGSCASGLIRRIGTFTGINQFVGGIIYPSGYRQGTLSGWDRGVVWPQGDNNIRISYSAGYQVIPADIMSAFYLFVAAIRNERLLGKPLASENYIDYAYSILASPTAGAPPEMDSIRGLLVGYVERAW